MVEGDAVPIFELARRSYHAKLLSTILHRDSTGIPSNADKDSVASVRFSTGILERLLTDGATVTQELRLPRLSGQRAGRKFEIVTAEFIQRTFSSLLHLRPGTWDVVSGTGPLGIAQFEQYSHLFDLAVITKKNPSLAVHLGSDYLIQPDIVVIRQTEPDSVVNERELLVNAEIAKHASLRKLSGDRPLLHASISCKWTLRSDRAQNARSEALNLIRSRKGRVPHIFCVTGEPTPARLASIALGTGDIDCVYHFALRELVATVDEESDSTAKELLTIMVEGRRLKDIADLPLDLAI